MEYYVSLTVRVDPEANFLLVGGDATEDVLEQLHNALYDLDDIEVGEIVITEESSR